MLECRRCPQQEAETGSLPRATRDQYTPVDNLRSGEVFRMANYVRHRNYRLTGGGGTAILVPHGLDHHAVPVQGLEHLEANAIQAILANKPVKTLAVYLPPSLLLFASDLCACLGGSFPVPMAGDLNARHVEWNSRLVTKRRRLLSDYAVKNSCPIYWPNTPTTVPYNPSDTPDVLDIIITKELVTPVYLTTCSALSSDHIRILIDTRCRSFFLRPIDRPDLRRTDWSNFQPCLKAALPSNPDIPNELAVDACVKEL
jgi:hypothetical protein